MGLLATIGLTMLASAASAAPAYPPVTEDTTVHLVANVTDCDLTPSIQGWVVESYHNGAGTGFAVLSAPDAEYPRAFYVNGTITDVRYGQSNLLTDGGTPPFAEGFIVPQANQTDKAGRRQVQINAGSGTDGVFFAQFPAQVPKLMYGNHEVMETFGSFYACNVTYLYGPAVGLFYHSYDVEKPDGCAAITLLPECAGNASHIAQDPQPAACYKNVASAK
ncbi:hypothetical protein K431DRAFT_280627 [Polychaeton citri CBS 116435]|uniref:DUF7907 domain-containing protein n=1 Tax=Polychaeton citri CBS 116435 TaxID=1314669 RepID=A0A9P4QEQ1_9PEZI|nr:hypothetical protein K431DRAFT_280627 [Polychaeton citri CBS 116435]